jgi:hypothetical protein
MLSLTHALDVLQNENINAFVKSEIPFALWRQKSSPNYHHYTPDDILYVTKLCNFWPCLRTSTSALLLLKDYKISCLLRQFNSRSGVQITRAQRTK